MYRPPDKIIVALVTRQAEIIQVGFGSGCIPVMVAKGREEAVFGCSRTVRAGIRENEIMVILADMGIDRISCAGWVIVIADRDEDVRIPAMDHGGHIRFALAAFPEIADHGEAHGWVGGWGRFGNCRERCRRGRGGGQHRCSGFNRSGRGGCNRCRGRHRRPRHGQAGCQQCQQA